MELNFMELVEDYGKEQIDSWEAAVWKYFHADGPAPMDLFGIRGDFSPTFLLCCFDFGHQTAFDSFFDWLQAGNSVISGPDNGVGNR